jgi:hypothetical protein
MNIKATEQLQTLCNSMLLNNVQAVSAVNNERIKRGNHLLKILLTGYPQLAHLNVAELLTELGPDEHGFGQKWYDYGARLWAAGSAPSRTAEIGATLGIRGVICCCLHVRGYIEAGRGG